MPGLGLGLGLDFLDAGTRVRDNAFKITVDTTQAGSASDTFVLPLHNGTSYDFEVDWGDGVVESVSGSSLTNKSHTYSSGGTYQISITGDFPRIFFNDGGDKAKLISIDNWGDIAWSSMDRAFYGCSNMVGTYTDAPNTSSVTNMGAMFRSCSSFNSPVNFDTSSVTTMYQMFFGCSSFNQSVSSFDTSSVTNMAVMFYACSSFNQSVSNFDTSSVTTMAYMFFGCSSFNQSVSNFDTSSVGNMAYMFYNCSSFNQSVSSFDTSLVTSMFQMLYGCSSFNQSVSSFDTSLVTSMSFMFGLCSSFNQSVSSFDTSSVTNMQGMFFGCSSFNQPVSNFDTSSVTSMVQMFRNCSSFKQSLATFDMTSVTNVTDMLDGCDINEAGTTTNYDNTLIAWEAQDLVDGLNFNGGTSKYSTTAEAARDAIINDDSWVITDGGIAEGILDLYTGAAAAYSLRQLATGSQTVVRVRRSSDNAEDDFTATEVVDGTMLTWVGTTASDDGFVTTWYDQSGSNDATQATAASQPKIVDAGVLVEENGKPAIDFDGNKSLTESSVSLTQPFSYFGVRKYNNDGLNREVFVQQNNPDLGKLIDISFVSNHANFGSYINGDTETYNQTLRYILANGVSSQIQDNGGTLYTDDGGTNGVNGLRIGYAALTSFFETNVKGQEIIIYNTDQSANRVGISNNINNHYNIYP